MTDTNTTSAAIYEFYSRMAGFVAGAATLMLSNALGLWGELSLILTIIALSYPPLIYLISVRFLNHLTDQSRRSLFICLDALLVGVLIAYMQFGPLPSLLFFIMVNTSAIVIGRFSIWVLCVFAVAIGAYIGGYLFGFQFSDHNNLAINLCVAIGIAIQLGITGFFSGKQTKQLEKLHKELKQQQIEQKSLSRKIAKYIAPQIWDSIFLDKKEVRLETQRKKLVVFFSDIQGFTALSEQIESEALTELLNNYLTEMTSIALKYGGTIDKYIGDSIMVFFGDPKTQGAKKDTLACVAMAIEMRQHMKVLRQKWRAQGVQSPLEIRMGINTGYCTVGNFGTESRMDYTIIGKEVNMASRLESAAEASEILVSHETYSLIQDKIICREKGSIRAKGFSRPVPVYQVVDFRHKLASKTSFVEHELPGFSMYMDTNRINNYDRDKIADALEKAAKRMKEQNQMKG